MSVKDVIRSFYHDLAQKNDAWQQHVAADVVFSDASKRLHAQGREAFIQSFTTFFGL